MKIQEKTSFFLFFDGKDKIICYDNINILLILEQDGKKDGRKKPTIVSGITATGQLTLGNYIGAIKNFIELQKDNNLIIFVANLHAITITIGKEELQSNIKNMIVLYYACGLDPNKAIIYVQSDVLELT